MRTSLDSQDRDGQPIPQNAPGLRFERYRSGIEDAVRRVLESGQYILGHEVEAFESEFADYLGVKHVVGVASGTDALSLSLDALGIGRGDEVLLPALSAPATAVAVARIGAVPRFVDVEPKTRGMDPSKVASAVTSRTRALVVVHLHGVPAQIEDLVDAAQRLGLILVEDCAQSHGATVGNRRTGCFGQVAAFSFYPTKNLGGFGDGGCVATNFCSTAARIRRRREYGWDADRVCIEPGFNSRLDELQAAVLRVLLRQLDQDNERRRRFAATYDEELRPECATHAIVLPPRHRGAVYHQYAIEVPSRQQIVQRLARVGIGTSVHYAVGLHRHPEFSRASSVGATSSFPVTERLTQSLLSMPIQPEFDHHASRIMAALKDALREPFAGERRP